MAEIIRTKIKSIYAEIKGYLISLPKTGGYTVPQTTVTNFNACIDKLSDLTQTDYRRFKVPFNAKPLSHTSYDLDIVKAQMQTVVTILEEEHGFGSTQHQSAPAIAIFNQNTNKVSVDINYTIQQLIEQTDNEEAKKNLAVLDSELSKPNSNWEVIKNVLLWVLNFSRDTFIQILPILIKKYLGQ